VTEPVSPATGWGVLHLFCVAAPDADSAAIVAAVKQAQGAEHTVLCASLLGHKADIAIMALGPDWRVLRALQSDLARAGLNVVDSYVSLTESSEYAQGLPPEMVENRLHPKLPAEGKPVFCFYPMSKRRDPGANWFAEPFDERARMMREHGQSGRKFAGRILQVVTGSTGLDAYEWGVTLFAQKPDDLKDVVYTMRYDEASTRFGMFGDFYVGFMVEPEALLG
jgi:hydrogen peroxide-dependent heme synthase